MSSYTAIVLAACIPAVATVVGFIVTYRLNKRNFEQEVIKAKRNIQLDKIDDLPHEILSYIDLVNEGFSDDMEKEAFIEQLRSKGKPMQSKIIAYGSKDAIKLLMQAAELGREYYEAPDDAKDKKLIWKHDACNVLLLCQARYDLTGIETNPEFWYRIRRPYYIGKEDGFIERNNKIVKDLNLNNFLLMK